MLNNKRRTVALLVFVFSLMQLTTTFAVELGAFGERIFSFQKKLAEKGNTLAEYKLGTLYEFGVSVEPDLDQASTWYKKAADKGYVPATNRLTYMEIKQSGFDKTKHTAWFENLKSQVDSEEPNALILWGQLHRQGINMEINLEKALAFLERASSLGHTEIDSQIDEIYVEIDTINAQHDEEVTNQETADENGKDDDDKTKKVSAKKSVNKTPAKAAQKPKADNKPSKEEIRAAKRRKYEEAMRKINEENQRLLEQQKWAEETGN